jgi:hypothetical protein
MGLLLSVASGSIAGHFWARPCARGENLPRLGVAIAIDDRGSITSIVGSSMNMVMPSHRFLATGFQKPGDGTATVAWTVVPLPVGLWQVALESIMK